MKSPYLLHFESLIFGKDLAEQQMQIFVDLDFVDCRSLALTSACTGAALVGVGGNSRDGIDFATQNRSPYIFIDKMK